MHDYTRGLEEQERKRRIDTKSEAVARRMASVKVSEIIQTHVATAKGMPS